MQVPHWERPQREGDGCTGDGGDYDDDGDDDDADDDDDEYKTYTGVSLTESSPLIPQWECNPGN